MTWPDQDTTSIMLRGILKMHVPGCSKTAVECVSANTSKASGGHLVMRANETKCQLLVEIVQKFLISTNTLSVCYTKFSVTSSS